MRALGTGRSFLEYAEYNIEELRKDGRGTTADMRQTQINKFSAFLGGDILIAEITPATITNYERWLKAQGNSIAYNGMLLTAVKTVINAAIRDGSVKYDIHPFAYWHATQAEPREQDITPEELRRIRDYNTIYKGEAKARDLLMLSYYLGGINLLHEVNMTAFSHTHAGGTGDHQIVLGLPGKTISDAGEHLPHLGCDLGKVALIG
jgi:hypothetical protein